MDDGSNNVSSGSRSGSQAESIDFRFLNFTNPADARNATIRRSVRSHVTSKQHEKQRKAAAAQARRTTEQYAEGAGPSGLRPTMSRSTSSIGSPDTETSSPEESPTSPNPGSPLVRLNPLEVYHEEWHPYLRPVMDHYINTMSIDLPETDVTSRGLIRDNFLAIVFSDRASLHATILAAAAHWNKMRPTQTHRINLLQLRGMAIQEINRSLVDHGRATSDALIAAVGKMATYELLFGQRDTFHTHMTGLQRMVSLRGGLQALGLDGLMERILLWIDSNAASITQGPLYFPPAAFSSSNGHPAPDRRLFLLGVQRQ
ncbi:hypothetical protein PRZ48_008120 [Zasmidium cellare]|uniref:Uncharacterized protein n=1 Tax=Zasmidium cellare TaxID=395010 RepID=A0ABR0EEY6_ZASCE|nr:hypothetical protein PRZ48_008120 [Zasmidium cellare]